jgi:hypothetical protein
MSQKRDSQLPDYILGGFLFCLERRNCAAVTCIESKGKGHEKEQHEDICKKSADCRLLCAGCVRMFCDSGNGRHSSHRHRGGTASTTLEQPVSSSDTTQTKESSQEVTPQTVSENQTPVTEKKTVVETASTKSTAPAVKNADGSTTTTNTDGNNGTTVQAASKESNTVSDESEQKKTVGDEILGEAKNYGIVCDNFHQRMDAETNVAAKTVDAVTNQHMGNDLTKNHNQKYLIGKVTDNASGEKWFAIKGKNDGKTTIVTSDKNGITLDGGFERPGVVNYDTSKTETDINDKIVQLKNSVVQRLSDAIQTAITSVEIKHGSKPGEDSAKWYLDLTDQKDGTYYVAVTDKDPLINNGQMYININPGKQTVILHAADTLLEKDGSLNFNKYLINGQGCDSYGSGSIDGDKATKSVVWDFRNVTGKLNINGSVTGIFIAPNAYVTSYAQSSGWMICKDMTIDTGEWHNINQDEDFAPEDSAVQDNNSSTTDSGSSGTSGQGGSNGNSGGTKDSSGGTGEGNNTNQGNNNDKHDGQTVVDQGEKGSSTTTNNDGQPSEQGTSTEHNTKDSTNQPSSGNQQNNPQPSDNTGSHDSTVSVTPGGDTLITPTPTLPSENTGEKNNTQTTNPQTNDSQTTPGTSTSDQTASTSQTKHNDAQNNLSAAGTDTAAGQTTGTQTVKAHAQNAKSTAPAVQRMASQTSTTSASASAAKSTIPRTADETSLGTELMLFGGAAALLAALLAVKKRKTE